VFSRDGRERPRPTVGAGALQQPVFLQFLAQGVAVNAQHLRRVGLVALRAQHHHLEDRLLDSEDDHVVNVRRLLFAQVVEIFFETFLDNFLDTFFAHFFYLIRLINVVAAALEAAFVPYSYFVLALFLCGKGLVNDADGPVL
jgi:hypothetical protein